MPGLPSEPPRRSIFRHPRLLLLRFIVHGMMYAIRTTILGASYINNEVWCCQGAKPTTGCLANRISEDDPLRTTPRGEELRSLRTAVCLLALAHFCAVFAL